MTQSVSGFARQGRAGRGTPLALPWTWGAVAVDVAPRPPNMSIGVRRFAKSGEPWCHHDEAIHHGDS